MSETFSPSDELDLTNDGTPNKELLFTVTEAKEEETDNGARVVLKFENRDEMVILTQRYWIRHNNEQAQKIGRGQLKAIAIALTGSPKFSIGSLEGRQLYATPKDKDGFTNLTRIRSTEEATA